MKRLISYLLVAALAALPVASSAQNVQRSAAVTLVANYNLTATSYTYSFFRGPDDANADPLGSGVKWPSKVKTTSGAQVTVEAFTASSAPFAALVAGDLLIFPNAPTVTNSGPSGVNVQGRTQRQERVIVTATDANNVDVDTAIDLSQDSTGYNFYWKKFKTGTETTDGWFSVGNFAGVKFDIQVTDIHADSIDYSIECRGSSVNATPKQLDSGSITSETLGSNSHTFYLGIPYDQCRVGLKVTNDTGAQAVWVEIVGEQYGSR